MIVEIGEFKLNTITPWAMKCGQVGRVLNGYVAGATILRTYIGIVSLNDPSQTWTFSSAAAAPLMQVEMLPKGTKITLTTEV